MNEVDFLRKSKFSTLPLKWKLEIKHLSAASEFLNHSRTDFRTDTNLKWII